jgi:hypothetical protein
MEFKVNVYKYWDTFYSLYKFNDGYRFNGVESIANRPNILSQFGLTFECQNSAGQYCFTVINEQKFAMMRLKYGV